MKTVKIGEKIYELKFTYNSLKYMGEFDTSVLEDMQVKPFKVFGMLEILMNGAINNNPKNFVPIEDVQEFLEIYIEENDMADLLDELLVLLQDSRFFKALQK